jgi:hypothetical protein
MVVGLALMVTVGGVFGALAVQPAISSETTRVGMA